MYYLGVDIGGMSIKCGLVDEQGQIFCVKSVPTKAGDADAIISDIAALCKDVVEDFGINLVDVAACGMGIPGTIDAEKGVIRYANNIDFSFVPIVKEFNKLINIPTFIGNDANAAALGEAVFGSAKGCKDVVFVTLGTGVGTGIIVDGKMILGKYGAGGEGGHITLKVNGEACSCGRRGCWEAYASATALMRQTKEAMAKNPDSLLNKIATEDGGVSGKTPFKAARMGDKTAKKLVSNYVKYVADGIISLVNIFRPECVIVGGGVSKAGDDFIAAVQRRVSRYRYGGSSSPKVLVKVAKLSNDAGIFGAAALAIDGMKK